jgi:hypothetical protein
VVRLDLSAPAMTEVDCLTTVLTTTLTDAGHIYGGLEA